MRKYLVTFKGKANTAILNELGATNIYKPRFIDRVVICTLDNDGKRALEEADQILSVELDEADVVGDILDEDEVEKGSYAYDFMEVSKFHRKGIKGDGVKVAVMDTGVQRHVDLSIAGGVNAFNNSLPYDNNLANGHGTRVAGVIAARGINEDFVGIAPNVSLYAIRIDDGGGSINRTHWSSQIIGMEWAIVNDIDVINCSFSSTVDSIARREAFKAAYDAGIAIFCSGGNRQGDVPLSQHTVAYPSIYPFVISTANINEDKTRYSTSSVGKGLNFSNGGVSIRTTNMDNSKSISDRYSTNTGTSYASPATAGMYCLYKSMFPNESREKLLQRMYVNAEKIGSHLFFGTGIPRFPNIGYENIIINERVN